MYLKQPVIVSQMQKYMPIKTGNCIIWVKSKPGEGTIFDIYLPICQSAQDSQTGLDEGLTKGKGRLLLVDDEPPIVEIGKLLLERIGYHVTSMVEPKDALKAFQQDPKAFDVLITDMTMPGINGYELVKMVRQIRPELPIIICTGFSEKISEYQIRKLGSAQLLMKPFTRMQLASAVRIALSSS